VIKLYTSDKVVSIYLSVIKLPLSDQVVFQ